MTPHDGSVGRVGQAWIAAVEQLGGRASEAAASAADLERRYEQVHRHYHNLAHVEAVLADVARLAAASGLDADDLSATVLAACSHDVVYDAVPGADERASAEWAASSLRISGVDDAAARRVQNLVLLTVTHTCDPADVAAAVLLDADLAVLAAPREAYANYVVAVRAEYGRVADGPWRTGRSEVLRNLLARDRLFVTAPGRSWWEQAARGNVARELALLQL